jgi:hypothetical protein
MRDEYLSKFHALGYTHDELEDLLKKLENRAFLTEEEYRRLVLAIEIVNSLSLFDGSYDSLTNKPDIVDVVRQSNEFAQTKVLHNRLAQLQKFVEITLNEFQREMAENKADINHLHDDRYSLINHMHEGVYVTPKELNAYVSKEYLEEVLNGFNPGPGGGGEGGGGSIYPTYVKPKLTATSNVTSVSHKKKTTVVLTPTYAQNDAGDLVKFSILKNNEVIAELTEVKSIEDTITLNHGESATYSFVVEYKDGIIKDTVAGDPYPDTSIKAGTVVVGITINCYANSYVGVIADKEFEESDIASLTPTSKKSKDYTYTFKLDMQKSVYMYPKSYKELESIKDSNGFDYISSYILKTITYDDVEYYVYVLETITIIDKFKQVFS